MNPNLAAESIEAPAPARGLIRGGLRLVLVGSIGLALVAAGLWLPWNSMWPTPDALNTVRLAVRAAVGILWLSAALLALARDPAGPLWKILFAYVAVDWLTWIFQFIPNLWIWSIGNTFFGLTTAVLVHALVAFPSGRLTNRPDRWLVAIVYAFTGITELLGRITWDREFCDPFPCTQNPFFLWKNDFLNDTLGTFNAIAIPIIGIVVVVAVVRHWRAAGPAARRALVPALVALPFAYVANITGYVGDNLGINWLSELGRHPILLAQNAIVPIGLFIGIARSRLGRGRVADLVVELSRGVPLGGLRDVLARTLGDPTLQLAFVAPDGVGLVDPSGQQVAMPAPGSARGVTRLERDGELLAILVHDLAIDEESPGLLDAVGSAARLAIDNERLSAQVRAQLEEVRASRTRIVEAADTERRRVERDLHDGAQQRLVALAIRLEQARGTVGGVNDLLDSATEELRDAIAEVRALARGLHPTILTEAGLAAAVESLAERTPIPVDVSIGPDRYPPSVEATAYFVIAEALTNVARYANATSARVEATVEADRLQIRVADDGHGGADPAAGSGLRGLADRVSAAGGSLSIESPLRSGTTIRVEIPLT